MQGEEGFPVAADIFSFVKFSLRDRRCRLLMSSR
jgi:hypothetical protein